jgi:3,4-dihydroxy 2-butanone 4-phosphate synthase/GTP cyclohydrolase II
MAGLRPTGVICEIVSEKDGYGMARLEELKVFAAEHGLAIISIADLIAWRRRTEKQVERVAEAKIPTAHGEFRAWATGRSWTTPTTSRWCGRPRRRPGRPGPGALRVPDRRRVRLPPLRLRTAAGRRAGGGRREGRGVVLYVRGHEGRGSA